MSNNGKIAENNFDGLLTGINPAPQVRGGIIAQLTTETTYPRGTVLAKSQSTNKLYILGTTPASGDTLTPDSILCDTITIGTTGDVSTAVYTAGCFNPEKVNVKDDYTMTEGDRDNLRMRNIVFLAPFEA